MMFHAGATLFANENEANKAKQLIGKLFTIPIYGAKLLEEPNKGFDTAKTIPGGSGVVLLDYQWVPRGTYENRGYFKVLYGEEVGWISVNLVQVTDL